MDWSNEQIMEFLEYYKNEPIIWDPSHANHRNWNKHHDAWKRIEMKFGQRYSIRELKRKKESLMASFRGLYNKVKHSRRNGSCPDELYKPTWFAYDKIYSFIKGKERPKGTINAEGNITREEIEKVKLEGASNPVQTRSLKRGAVNKAAASSRKSNSSSKATQLKRTKIHELVDQPKTAYPPSYSTLPPLVTEKIDREKDICDIYGELITAKLRRLDEHSREIAMNRIDNLFFDISMNRGTLHTFSINGPDYSQRCPSPNQALRKLADKKAPQRPPNSPSTSSRSSLSSFRYDSSASVPSSPR